VNAEEHYQAAMRLLEGSDLPDYSASEARDLVDAAHVHAVLAAYRADYPEPQEEREPVMMDLGGGRRVTLDQWISGVSLSEEDAEQRTAPCGRDEPHPRHGYLRGWNGFVCPGTETPSEERYVRVADQTVPLRDWVDAGGGAWVVGSCVLEENAPELMFRDGGAHEVTDDFTDGKLWADLWTAIHAADPSSVPNPERLTANSLRHEARVLAAYKAVKDYWEDHFARDRHAIREKAVREFRRRAADLLCEYGHYAAAARIEEIAIAGPEEEQ